MRLVRRVGRGGRRGERSYTGASVQNSTGDEAHLNRIHCDGDGFYLGLPNGLLGRSFPPLKSPMMVLERARESCLGDERRGGAMSDLALALAFVAALALAIGAIYMAATS